MNCFVRTALICCLLLAYTSSANAQDEKSDKHDFTVTVTSATDRSNAIVRSPIKLGDNPPIKFVLTDQSGNSVTAQVSTLSASDLTKPGYSGANHEIHFVVPEIKSGKPIVYAAMSDNSKSAADAFTWHDDGSAEAQLQFGGKPVIKYMYQPLDESTKEKRAETYKPYHLVYRPDGKSLMTKPHGGLFPHHRGLYYGFNRISYDGKQADVWHCKDGACQTHEKRIEQTAGLNFGRDLNAIHWRGKSGDVFVTELRETTCRRIGDALVIDFHSTLRNNLDKPIEFRGDPQHAGAQFRASQDLPDHTKHLTYYVRPDGPGKPGEFRNWSAKKGEKEINKQHINLDYNALVMHLPKDPKSAEGKLTEAETDRFTVCYLNSPENPKPSRFSERDYGRFGCYFEYDLAPKSAFSVNYRYYIVPGGLSKSEIDKLSADYSDPVNVVIK